MKPGIRHLSIEAVRRLFADEAVPLAGNIAFRTLFSVFPFLIFLTALGGFFGNAELAERVVGFLMSVAPKQLVEPLAPEITHILTVPRGGLLSLSAALTVWSAMAGVDSVRAGLNRAYDVKEHRSLHWLFLQDILVVIGSAVMLLVLALLVVLAPVLIAFVDAHAPRLVRLTATFDTLRYPAAIFLLFGTLLLAHRILPARRMSSRALLPGVALTVVVWIALSASYGYFLSHFASFASTYAGLSGLFAAMFFIYLAALVLILGGEVNRVIAIGSEGSSPTPDLAKR